MSSATGGRAGGKKRRQQLACSHIVTGASTLCTFDSSTSISVAFWHSSFTSASVKHWHRLSASIAESRFKTIQAGTRPRP